MKKINILGQTYKVVALKSPPMWRHDKGKNKLVWGDMDDTTLRYYAGSGPFTMQVFLHELTHVILDNIGRKDLSRDERLVNNISRALADAFMQNKELLPWLLKQRNK